MNNIYSQSGQITYGIKYRMVDTEEERESLPTKDKMGSKCYVIESKKWYILNGNQKWVPFVPEDGTPEAVLSAINNMDDEQIAELKEILNVTGGAVYSVNGQTGAVDLDAEDVNAEPQKLTAIITQHEFTYSANKTFVEMWTAYHIDHKTVTVEMGDTEFVLSAADPSGMAFSSLSVGSGNATLSMLTVDENDDWSYAEFAAEQKPATVTVSGTTPTIAAAANTAYNCGELASLTVSSFPATGAYSIVFTSGATATVTTIPATILGLESFAAEANTLYEINVLDNRAVVGSWAVSA